MLRHAYFTPLFCQDPGWEKNNTHREFCAKWQLILEKKKTFGEQTYNCMYLWEVVFVVQPSSSWHVRIWACRHLWSLGIHGCKGCFTAHALQLCLLTLFASDLNDVILCGIDRSLSSAPHPRLLLLHLSSFTATHAVGDGRFTSRNS